MRFCFVLVPVLEPITVLPAFTSANISTTTSTTTIALIPSTKNSTTLIRTTTTNTNTTTSLTSSGTVDQVTSNSQLNTISFVNFNFPSQNSMKRFISLISFSLDATIQYQKLLSESLQTNDLYLSFLEITFPVW